MKIDFFLFNSPNPSLQKVVLEAKAIEKRLQDKDHVSFLASFHSNWECGERLYIVQFIFEECEDKLKAACKELIDLEKLNKQEYDLYIAGQIECVKHLIRLLAE